MFCKKCGNKLTEDSNFCDNCGHRSSVGTVLPTNAISKQDEEGNRHNKKVLGIVFSILAIFLIFLIYSGSSDNNDSEKEQASNTGTSNLKPLDQQQDEFGLNNWQTVTSYDGKFTVKLPKGWEEDKTSDSDYDKLVYYGKDDMNSYIIRREDFAQMFIQNGLIKLKEEDKMKFLQMSMNTILEAVNGKLIDSQPSVFNDLTALKFSASVNDGYIEKKIKGLTCIDDSMTYTFIEIANSPDFPEWENFINSFSSN